MSLELVLIIFIVVHICGTVAHAVTNLHITKRNYQQYEKEIEHLKHKVREANFRARINMQKVSKTAFVISSQGVDVVPENWKEIFSQPLLGGPK